MKKILLLAALALFAALPQSAQAYTCPINMPGCVQHDYDNEALAKIRNLNVYALVVGSPNNHQSGFSDSELIAEGLEECVSFFNGDPEGVIGSGSCLIHPLLKATKELDAIVAEVAADALAAQTAANNAAGFAQDAYTLAQTANTNANSALTAAGNGQKVYVDGTLITGAREVSCSATTSSGTATFYLTDNCQSNGASLCPTAVYKKTANFWVDDNSAAQPSFGSYSISGDRKTMTINAKRPQTDTLLGIVILRSTMANIAATEVNMRVICN